MIKIAKKTQEEFVNEINIKLPNIKILGRYINSKERIEVQCKICGQVWNPKANDLSNGHGCSVCYHNNRRMTHQTFIEKLSKLLPHILVLDQYINAVTPLLVKCTDCGNEWKSRPETLLKGHGCLNCCNIKQTKTHEEFVSEISNINPNIEIISKYINNKTPIKAKCKTCGNIVKVRPSNLLSGANCPVCSVNNRRKSHLEFIEQLEKIDNSINVIGTYVNALNKIEVVCKKCGTQWASKPNDLLNYHGCPNCHNKSRGENKVKQYLIQRNIDYILQHRFCNCKNINTLPFDFYIPSLNACIEYDGEQHFRPVSFGGHNAEKALQKFKETCKNDNIKNEYCKNNKIKLIRIPYTEFNNIERFLEEKL